MDIGEKIKNIRKTKGLTQKELAQKLGVSQAMITQYEKGLRKPKPDTIKRIAMALGVDYYDIDSSPSGETISEILQGNTALTQSDIMRIATGKMATLSEEELEKQLYDLFISTLDEQRQCLIDKYNLLNSSGRERLIEYAIELTKILEYKTTKK